MPADIAIEFLARQGPALLRLVDRYLAEQATHEDAISYAWAVIDEWGELGISDKAPDSSAEELFWSLIWGLQHLADSEHWRDGATRRELRPLVNAFRNGGEIPPGISALRP